MSLRAFLLCAAWAVNALPSRYPNLAFAGVDIGLEALVSVVVNRQAKNIIQHYESGMEELQPVTYYLTGVIANRPTSMLTRALSSFPTFGESYLT